jgi:hypothetical protein
MTETVRRKLGCPGLPPEADTPAELAIPEPSVETGNPRNAAAIRKRDGRAKSLAISLAGEEQGRIVLDLA